MKLKKQKLNAKQSLDLVMSLATRLIEKPFDKNEVRQLEGGFLSYNPSTDCGAETAISNRKKYFILLGDYRNELRNCKTLHECVKEFKILIRSGAKVSKWSDYEYK